MQLSMLKIAKGGNPKGVHCDPSNSTICLYMFPMCFHILKHLETFGDFEARSQTARFDGEIHRGMKN